MPPPRAKLHKNTGKSKPGPQTQRPSHISNPNQTNGTSGPSTSSPIQTINLTPEEEMQFEAELCWCIRQLQLAISSNKLNEKQVRDNAQALNTLMSHTAPMIRKRQVMRMSFGDYRSKMAAEEKKVKKISMKVTPAKPNEKSVFIRKAIVTSSDNNFRFNFDNTIDQNLPEEGASSKENAVVEKVVETNLEPDKNIYVKSDNSFRFNFTLEDSNDNS